MGTDGSTNAPFSEIGGVAISPEAEVEQLRKSLATAEADRARLLAENAALRGQLIAAEKHVEIVNEANLEFLHDKNTLACDLDEQRERADAAEARVQALAAENAALREAHLYLLTGWREEAACLRRDGRVIRAEATEKCADQLRAALAPSQGADQ